MKELKETIELTLKMQENTSVEMRKVQTQMIELKNILGEKKTSLEGLIDSVTAAEYRIRNMEDELDKTLKRLKSLKKQTDDRKYT